MAEQENELDPNLTPPHHTVRALNDRIEFSEVDHENPRVPAASTLDVLDRILAPGDLLFGASSSRERGSRARVREADEGLVTQNATGQPVRNMPNQETELGSHSMPSQRDEVEMNEPFDIFQRGHASTHRATSSRNDNLSSAQDNVFGASSTRDLGNRMGNRATGEGPQTQNETTQPERSMGPPSWTLPDLVGRTAANPSPSPLGGTVLDPTRGPFGPMGRFSTPHAPTFSAPMPPYFHHYHREGPHPSLLGRTTANPVVSPLQGTILDPNQGTFPAQLPVPHGNTFSGTGSDHLPPQASGAAIARPNFGRVPPPVYGDLTSLSVPETYSPIYTSSEGSPVGYGRLGEGPELETGDRHEGQVSVSPEITESALSVHNSTAPVGGTGGGIAETSYQHPAPQPPRSVIAGPENHRIGAFSNNLTFSDYPHQTIGSPYTRPQGNRIGYGGLGEGQDLGTSERHGGAVNAMSFREQLLQPSVPSIAEPEDHRIYSYSYDDPSSAYPHRTFGSPYTRADGNRRGYRELGEGPELETGDRQEGRGFESTGMTETALSGRGVVTPAAEMGSTTLQHLAPSAITRSHDSRIGSSPYYDTSSGAPHQSFGPAYTRAEGSRVGYRGPGEGPELGTGDRQGLRGFVSPEMTASGRSEGGLTTPAARLNEMRELQEFPFPRMTAPAQTGQTITTQTNRRRANQSLSSRMPVAQCPSCHSSTQNIASAQRNASQTRRYLTAERNRRGRAHNSNNRAPPNPVPPVPPAAEPAFPRVQVYLIPNRYSLIWDPYNVQPVVPRTPAIRITLIGESVRLTFENTWWSDSESHRPILKTGFSGLVDISVKNVSSDPLTVRGIGTGIAFKNEDYHPPRTGESYRSQIHILHHGAIVEIGMMGTSEEPRSLTFDWRFGTGNDIFIVTDRLQF